MSPTVLEQAIQRALLARTQEAASIYIPPPNARSYKCGEVGCSRVAYAGGLCNAHYIRLRKGMDMTTPVRARKRADECSQCGEKTGVRGGWGMCQKHYRYARYAAIKDAAIEAMGARCAACKGEFPRRVFDFHHEGDKTESPSALMVNRSVADIARELSTCALLCANCHRLEHNNEL